MEWSENITNILVVPMAKNPHEQGKMIALSNILVAEFTALRREIEICIEHQKEIMNFSVLTFVAMIGLFGVAKTRSELESIAPAFLFFPFIFCLLVLLYADKTVRILRVADYIHNYLRRRVNETGIWDEDFWFWESYKSHKASYSRKLAMRLDRARWLIFIIPSVIAIGLFFLLYGIPCINKEEIIFLLFLDVFAIIVIIYVIPHLEETAPIKDRKPVDLKDSRKRRKKWE